MLNTGRFGNMKEDDKKFFDYLLATFPKNNIDRVRYRLNNQELPRQDEVKLEKCSVKALAARNIGNRLFIEKNYLEALKAYNESLCWAPNGSDSLAIAYANRSAIYLKCGFFTFCLENIELALENNYPERLKPKLLKRKEECLEKMKSEKDSIENYDYKDLTKLTYPANPKIPSMIEGIELKKNDKYGRHLVAKHDLKIGDIVMIEEPFVKSHCHKKMVYSNCFHCCMSNFLNLRPCPKTTKAMFCSVKCSEDAWNESYQYLWPIIDGVWDSELLFQCHVAIKAFTLLDDPMKLRELLDSAKSNPITVFDVDMTQADELTKFKILFSLVAKESSVSVRILETMRSISLNFYMLKEFTEFKKLIKTRELEDLFLEIFIHFHWLKGCNSHGVLDRLESRKNFDENLFVGIFLGCAFLNHSCIANTSRMGQFGKLFFVVSRPIKAGEQIFDNYGTQPVRDSLEERRNHLIDPYQFVCDCEACTFEIHHILKEPKNFLVKLPKLKEYDRQLSDRLCPFDEITLFSCKAAKKEMIKYLTENKMKFCSELVIFNGMLNNCFWLEIIKKPLPVMLSP